MCLEYAEEMNTTVCLEYAELMHNLEKIMVLCLSVSVLSLSHAHTHMHMCTHKTRQNCKILSPHICTEMSTAFI